MSCLIKNVPSGYKLFSGNRGNNFPYKECNLPPEEVCYLATDDYGNEIELNQENGDTVILRCIE